MKKSIITAILLGGIMGVNAQSKQDSIKNIEEVELFGELRKQPKGLEIITRMPLQPKDQLQNISVISNRAITEMGALSITDATRNVPGVVLLSTYGGGAESMSIRGYRGVPTLKNGVMMFSDFRRTAVITDMQGVESIQVIRGAAAITQGIGHAFGAAGGVINVVTKTPQFINRTNVGFRYGSWDTYRPTLDFQRVFADGKVAVRLNVAYQNNKSFTDYVDGERLYIQPSVAFRPDDKTQITLQMDYLNNRSTPDRGTVNLADGDTYAIYDLPKNKFLGFDTDYSKDKAFSYMISADRKLNEKLKVRVAYMASDEASEGMSTGNLTTISTRVGSRNIVSNYALRNRSITKSYGEDHNQVFQADFVGKDIKTGIFKHTFQLGFDWRETYTVTADFRHKTLQTRNGRTGRMEYAAYIPVDVINVLGDVNNILPASIDLSLLENRGNTTSAKTPMIGVMAQEVLEIGNYVKLFGGVRYSRVNGTSQAGKKYAWDPSFGLMISPMKNINLYGSYTTTTSLRGNNNPLEGGGTVGTSVTKQIETGFKSDWFNEKLRFNANFYFMELGNMSYAVVDASGRPNGKYELAGDLVRKGVEVEVIGKIIPQLEIIGGYSYLDAKYKNSPAYVNGSSPFMAAKHTANGWLNYTFREGILRGLNFGGGVYYVGKRPVNEYTTKNAVHDTTPGMKPFDLKDYTTLNAQIGYNYQNFGVKVFFNNITDAIGYNAYLRGGFLNRNDPRNFAVQVNYKF